MKKVVMVTLALSMIFALGIVNAFAFGVTWENAYGPFSNNFKELSAGSALYGIDENDTIVAVDLTPTVNVSDTLQASNSVTWLDLAATHKGTVFAINDTTVVTWTAEAPTAYTPLSLQPKVPYVEGATVAGTFKHIAFGDGGKLFILFQKTGDAPQPQYILTGRYVKETMEVTIDPRTLNLGSKGNWVSCKIGLPDKYSEKDIDPATVEIINLQANGKSAPVTIFIAESAPHNADNSYLHVKFSRSELSTELLDLLSEATGSHKYPVTATVRAQLNTDAGGDVFEGDAVFQAITPKGKK
jgi:hypothetical protein